MEQKLDTETAYKLLSKFSNKKFIDIITDE